MVYSPTATRANYLSLTQGACFTSLQLEACLPNYIPDYEPFLFSFSSLSYRFKLSNFCLQDFSTLDKLDQ